MTEVEDVVIDASALVALLIDGGETGDLIASRLSPTRVHGPHHLLVETLNVLRRRRNGGLLTPAQASAAVRDLLILPIDLWPLDMSAERVWELGDNLSSYDAAYVALAERLRAPLLTLDARLARAPGVRCRVELFG